MAKKEKADIWMPLFIGDYLADTTRLTTEQHGAYFLLIIDYWRNGAPPDDDAILANITKLPPKDWKRIKPVMARLFRVSDGLWKHKRIEQELADAEKGKKKAEEKAKKAAESRWGKVAAEHTESDTSSNPSCNTSSNAPSITEALHKECPSPSPSPSKEPKSKAEAALATRLPADWQPSDDDVAFCRTERPDLEPMRVAANFRDYWIGIPGVKGRKLDWPATWRNWVRKEGPQARTSPSSKPAKFDPVAHVNRTRNEPNERPIIFDESGEPV